MIPIKLSRLIARRNRISDENEKYWLIARKLPMSSQLKIWHNITYNALDKDWHNAFMRMLSEDIFSISLRMNELRKFKRTTRCFIKLVKKEMALQETQ